MKVCQIVALNGLLINLMIQSQYNRSQMNLSTSKNISTFNRSFLPIGTLLLFYYLLRGTAPGMVPGDGPELSTACWSLGVAHPPGYPLYVLLGRMASQLGIGTVAFRLNLFSILCQILSFWILFQTLSRRVASAKSWLILTVLFVLFGSPLMVDQGTSSEVYALHLVLATWLLDLTVNPRADRLYELLFAFGLSLSNHHLTLLLVPALVFSYKSYIPDSRRALTAISLCFMALSPYLVLPIRSHLYPVADWGHPANWTAFIKNVSRAQYGGDFPKGSLTNGLVLSGHYLWVTLTHTGFIGLPLAIWALWRRKDKRNPEVWGVCAWLILLPLLVRSPIDPAYNAVVDTYYPTALVWLAPLMLEGLYAVQQSIKSNWLNAGFAGLLLIGASFQCIHSSKSDWNDGNLTAEDSSRDILLNLPSHSVLFSEGDTVTFPLAYLTKVYALRPDLKIFDRFGNLFDRLYDAQSFDPGQTFPSFGERVGSEIKWSESHSNPRNFYNVSQNVPGRSLIRRHLLFEADPKVEKDDLTPFWNYPIPPRLGSSNDFLSRTEAGGYYAYLAADTLQAGATITAISLIKKTEELAPQDSHLMVYVGKLYLQAGDSNDAERLMHNVISASPNDADALFQLGLKSAKEGKPDLAMEYMRQTIAANPQHTQARNELAVMLFTKKENNEGIAQLERILEIDPTFPEAYKNLGLALWQTDPARSSRLFHKYLELRPNDPQRPAIERLLLKLPKP